MLLRARLLQMFYSIRSERQLMGRLAFDLLFRWFVGLGIANQAWDHSSFFRNRDRLLAGGIAAQFLAAVLAWPRVRRLLSSDHFSVDGTLIEAWASIHVLQAQGSGRQRSRERSAAVRRRAQRRGRLQGSDALERDPREHNGPRSPPLP
ncbi:hypothetical protein ASG51_04295 [Methylobacterium sp. Leaf465]|nr:hypothetical protein ASG51_04295 [Methylobacterium sp. Leaf465]